MTDLSLILFDLNGVLYRYDRDARIAYLSAVSHCPPETILDAIWGSGFEDSGDAGSLTEAAYLQGFGARIGHALSEADWVAAQQAAVTPIPETLALLPRLRPDLACAVLTNNNLLVRRHFARLYPQVAALVHDRAFVSAEFNARKPDTEAYLRCLTRLDVEPNTVLFVDDSPANVCGARAAGLIGCDYSGPADLTAEFARRGLLR